MRVTILLAGLATNALAAPAGSSRRDATPLSRPAVTPQLKSANLMANATDPDVDRDSCGSVRIGNRAFWTCRDTMRYDRTSGTSVFPVISNSAGWSETSEGGLVAQANAEIGPGSTGGNMILPIYGSDSANEFFPNMPGDCDENHGQCWDGTRWAVWPNSPPMVAAPDGENTVAYSWVPQSNLHQLTLLNPFRPYTLYKTTYSPSQPSTTLPTVSIANPTFWAAGEPGYGDYGNVVRDGYAYLYAQRPDSSGTLLARAPITSIEDRSTYTYYTPSTGWTTTLPSLSDPAATLPNAGTGWQGTFYYSTAFSSYIWIGQALNCPSAEFYITTAPAPEGPWIEPYVLWKGESGDGMVGAYSLQAHTSLLPSGDVAAEKGIFVSFTQAWGVGVETTYVTPLVYLELE
ncbi:unnamed protein product [Zymoseptoria tritici ST99CH_3D1]|nr:unnamed protein product [Zymoseptoria tritici ST99CH_3D1]